MNMPSERGPYSDDQSLRHHPPWPSLVKNLDEQDPDLAPAKGLQYILLAICFPGFDVNLTSVRFILRSRIDPLIAMSDVAGNPSGKGLLEHLHCNPDAVAYRRLMWLELVSRKVHSRHGPRREVHIVRLPELSIC